MRRFSPRRLVLAVLIAISALWLLYLCASFMFNRQKSILRYQIEQELQKYVSLSDTMCTLPLEPPTNRPQAPNLISISASPYHYKLATFPLNYILIIP